MKHIFFMRHGEPLQIPGLDNFDFPLSENGRKAAVLKGEILSRKGVVPDAILSSPALRAKTTAEMAAESCGYRGEITFDGGLYKAFGGEIVLDSIRALPESVGRVMVVGHNPMLRDLVYELTSPPKFIPMNPATLVALTLEDCAWSDLGPGRCRFAWTE